MQNTNRDWTEEAADKLRKNQTQGSANPKPKSGVNEPAAPVNPTRCRYRLGELVSVFCPSIDATMLVDTNPVYHETLLERTRETAIRLESQIKRMTRDWPICPFTGKPVEIRTYGFRDQVKAYFICLDCNKRT